MKEGRFLISISGLHSPAHLQEWPKNNYYLQNQYIFTKKAVEETEEYQVENVMLVLILESKSKTFDEFLVYFKENLEG